MNAAGAALQKDCLSAGMPYHFINIMLLLKPVC
jgi:hypothetical protein